MKKNFLSFLILSFLSLQTFSFLHNAEFGFEEHDHGHEHEHEDEHDKDICEIYLYCEQTKDNNSDLAKSLEVSEYFIFVFVLDRNFDFYSKKHKLISTRAPPQFS